MFLWFLLLTIFTFVIEQSLIFTRRLGIFSPLYVVRRNGKIVSVGPSMDMHANKQVHHFPIFSLWPPKDESDDIPISLSLNWCESSNLDMRTISTVQTPTSLQSKKVLLAATPLGISYFQLTTTFHENYKVLKSRLDR